MLSTGKGKSDRATTGRPSQGHTSLADSGRPDARQPATMEANFAIVGQRWPDVAQAIERAADSLPPFSLEEKSARTLYVDGIHLTSAYDRLQEAQLQAAEIPDDSARAWVYGLALGDIPRVLLKRRQLKELTVVVMNSSVAALSLYFFDHRDWLADPRVTLAVATPTDRLHAPFATAPGCLQLACDEASRLRDMVCLERATPFIRQRHKANNPHLQKRLADNADYVALDPSFEELAAKLRSGTVVVAAAGPTLSDQYSWLQSRKPGPIIAVDAALKPLMHAGIVPDIVIAIDGHADIYDLFFADLDLDPLRDSALVYFPVVQTETLKNWPGNRYAAWSSAPIYDDLSRRYARQRLFSSGSVIHPAVDLATRISAVNIILAGADFAFPGGQSHVAGCHQAQRIQGSHWVLNGHGKRVETIPNLRAYLRDLETFLSTRADRNFFNASAKGAAILHTTLLTERP